MRLPVVAMLKRNLTSVSRVQSALQSRTASPALPFQRPQFVVPNRFASLPQPQVQAKFISAPVPQRIRFSKPVHVLQSKVISGQPRFYPNLNPAAAALQVDPSEFLKLESSFGDDSYYRMRRGGDHGLLVPNTKYIFVRTMTGEMVMHQRYRHPVLAAGKPVLYAGEAYFNNGRLDWWSNGSGNYRPDPDHAGQSNLPMERFFPFEDVLKGKHRQQ